MLHKVLSPKLHNRNNLSFNKVTKSCVCNPILSKHGIECDVQTQTIERVSPQWIDATYVHLIPTEHSGVIVHDHCPFDYCTPTSGVAQSLDLLYPDEQCSFNRSGILCGACQTNFIHVLGTSKCKQCTVPWIALMIRSTPRNSRSGACGRLDAAQLHSISWYY